MLRGPSVLVLGWGSDVPREPAETTWKPPSGVRLHPPTRHCVPACVRVRGAWCGVLAGCTACSLRLGCSRGEVKASKRATKSMLLSLALAAADADVGKAVDQGRDGPLGLLLSIARSLTLVAARRAAPFRARLEALLHSPAHLQPLDPEAIDASTLVAVSGGGGGVR